MKTHCESDRVNQLNNKKFELRTFKIFSYEFISKKFIFTCTW